MAKNTARGGGKRHVVLMQMEAFVQIAHYERSSSLLTYGLLRGFLCTDGRCEVVNQTLVFCYEEWFEGLEL